jgi:hypothetical protein
MHPLSPHVSAPDGIATLLYKMGREEWLKRFLDVEGTYKFELVMKKSGWQDLYVKRSGPNVEVRHIMLKEHSDLTLVIRLGFLAVGSPPPYQRQVSVILFSHPESGSPFLPPILASGVVPQYGFAAKVKHLRKPFGITNDGPETRFYQSTGRESRMSKGRKTVFGVRILRSSVSWGIYGM